MRYGQPPSQQPPPPQPSQGYQNPVSPIVPVQPKTSKPSTPWKRKKLFNSPFPRYRHTASAITADNGCSFVMGGLRDDNVYGDIWLIAPIGSEYTPNYSYLAQPIESTEGVPAPRVCHDSILIGNAFIVFGGDTILLNDEGKLDNDLYFFNINSMKWTTPSPRGPKPSGRYGHTITVVTFQNSNDQDSLWSSYLYLFGGQLDDDRFNDMWCFDLSNFRKPTTQWRQIFQNDSRSEIQPPPLANHTMNVYDGRIFVFGGSTTGGVLSNTLYCFDPVKESWSVCEYSSKFQPPPMEEHSAVLYEHFLVIIGGKNAQGVTINDFILIDLHRFEVMTIETPDLGSPGKRAGHSLTYDMQNEKLLIMGGDQLNLQHINTSRDIFVPESDNDGEKFDDLTRFTNIDPQSLSYETTYIYEFDLKLLDEFINRSPEPRTQDPVPESLSVNLDPLHRVISSAKTESSLGDLDEQDVVSSTPLKGEDHNNSSLGPDSTAGSIQLARKVSISRSRNEPDFGQSSGPTVRRVDSINVHKNRRIKSAGSYAEEKAEIVNSSGNATPVLNKIDSTDSREQIFTSSLNHTEEVFKTPDTSSVSVPTESVFKPYNKVGSKVDMYESDDEENQSSPVGPRPVTNGRNGTSESLDTSSTEDVSLLEPKNSRLRAHIPSTLSDATMNSFLDNYTSKTESYDLTSSKDQLRQSLAASSQSFADEGEEIDDKTPLVGANKQFEDTPRQAQFTPNGSPHVKDQKPSTEDLSLYGFSSKANNQTPTASRKPSSTNAGALDTPESLKSRRSLNAELYDRLNDLKLSLNEKMVIASEKISSLERLNSQKDEEIETLKAQLTEKTDQTKALELTISELETKHKNEIEMLHKLIAEHEKSKQDHTSVVESLDRKSKDKDIELDSLRSSNTEHETKIKQYEVLLNDRLLNINNFNRVLQKQKDYVKEQQLQHLSKEEEMLKKINEVKLENENLKIEFERYKKAHDIHKSQDLSREASYRSVSENVASGAVEEDFNDSSINDLSQGLDRLMATFRSVSGNHQLPNI